MYNSTKEKFKKCKLTKDMENCSQYGNKLSWHYPSRKKPVEHVKVIFHQTKSPLKKKKKQCMLQCIFEAKTQKQY